MSSLPEKNHKKDDFLRIMEIWKIMCMKIPQKWTKKWKCEAKKWEKFVWLWNKIFGHAYIDSYVEWCVQLKLNLLNFWLWGNTEHEKQNFLFMMGKLSLAVRGSISSLCLFIGFRCLIAFSFLPDDGLLSRTNSWSGSSLFGVKLISVPVLNLCLSHQCFVLKTNWNNNNGKAST